ncbi:replication protein P [Cronobacter sakazakii]|uniref:replication protein P n=1 Tax=Cronobacter sakazakii TaxID=28141 RepID=UPI000CFC82C7|nr:replication protein P [Cronobacter sakazakii]ELY6202259.1 DNA replication protein [Cronobacter malonaticus]ELY6256134.1 DNA replication protein [Cronobacter malonaticus]PQY71830.1 DNA replication protein [Cronobacter sakazakii]PRV94208.1 DNA replication protein [Cronobacter sakazakii]
MSEQLIQAIVDKDSQTLSRLANKYQPSQERTAKSVVNTEAERLVDALFRQLKQVFPASAATSLRTEADEAVAKQQWILAFAENGITKREQLAAGMKRARASHSPFLPSPGLFISWCREGELEQAGLPSPDELVAMVHTYCARVGLYAASTEYPWKHPTHYWMVTRLYSEMRLYGWTESELIEQAKKELSNMVQRITSGEKIPAPVSLIERSESRQFSREKGLKIIAKIKKEILKNSNKS